MRHRIRKAWRCQRLNGLNPGYLVQSASGMDEGVIIHIDGKIRAVCIGMNNFTQNGVNTLLGMRLLYQGVSV